MQLYAYAVCLQWLVVLLHYRLLIDSGDALQ